MGHGSAMNFERCSALMACVSLYVSRWKLMRDGLLMCRLAAWGMKCVCVAVLVDLNCVAY